MFVSLTQTLDEASVPPLGDASGRREGFYAVGSRRRREAERNKRLEEVFREADTNGNGKITPEQMIKIFEVNDCPGDSWRHNICSNDI